MIMWHIMMLILFVAVNGDDIPLFRLYDSRPGLLKNRRLLRADQLWHTQVDFTRLVEATSYVGKSQVRISETGPGITIESPMGTRHCSINSGVTMSAGLRRKYPEIVDLMGSCDDRSTLNIVYDASNVSSLSAEMVTLDSTRFYMDHVHENSFVWYDKSKVFHSTEDSKKFRCGVEQWEDVAVLENKLKAQISILDTTKINKFKFRLAIVANAEYSLYHGNTTTSVLASLVTMMSRVNGIFLLELSTFLEMVEDTAICLGSTCEGNGTLPNDWRLINEVGPYLSKLGIEDYDLGHGVSTGAGGLAAYPSMCTSSKARGITGLSDPVGDGFYVDYVAHEIGHQLYGAHSFRNCRYPDSNIQSAGAVEPGSGSSIMSYAGICSSNNLQSNSDAYFNSVNLVQMRGYIERMSASGCGSVTTTTLEKPTVNLASLKECTVPLENYFSLSGEASNADLFSWDRVDTGYESYSDTAIGRFRSWRPVTWSTRVFPSMYLIAKGLTTSQMIERLPKASKSMKFRFTARSKHQDPQVGAFDTADVTVNFERMRGLRFSTSTRVMTLREGRQSKFYWKTGSTKQLTPWVEILIAEDTMPLETTFQYHLHEQQLKWTQLAVLPNRGVGFVTIPHDLNFAGDKTILLMIRSNTGTGCEFFDVVVMTKKLYQTKQPTVFPTSRPLTGRPSKSPSQYPTRRPVTGRPSKSPTAFPTRRPAN